MNNKLTIIFTLSILLTIGLACEFTTANLSDITFSGDEKNTETFKSVEQGEKIYAHSAINNANGEHKVRWKVTNSDGEEIELPKNEMTVDGARNVWLNLTLNPRVFKAGDYKFQLVLLNKNGDKEFETKTATLEVTK